MTAAVSRNIQSLKAIPFKHGKEGYRPKTKVPAVNINETDMEYILMLAAPGFSKEALQIKIEKGILSVEAEKNEDYKDCIHDRCEYDLTCWKRKFVLPADANGLMTRATYLNGELIIRIPRGKAGNSPFIIPIYVY